MIDCVSNLLAGDASSLNHIIELYSSRAAHLVLSYVVAIFSTRDLYGDAIWHCNRRG